MTAHDLPPELESQLLRRDEPPELERRIDEAIWASGGTADLNQVLIRIYRDQGIVENRRRVQNALYRMKKKGRVRVVGRGLYTLEESP